MTEERNYSLRGAAISLFIGLFIAGSLSFAVGTTLNAIGGPDLELVLEQSLGIAAYFVGLVFAGYRAAYSKASEMPNAAVLAIFAAWLVMANAPEGLTFTQSVELPKYWHRAVMLTVSGVAPFLGALIRSKRREEDPEFGEIGPAQPIERPIKSLYENSKTKSV